jgi:hypothetical protein
MPNLENASVTGRGFDQSPRGSQVMSDGLLNEYVDAIFEECASDFGMMRSRYCNNGRVDFACQLRGCCINRASVFRAGSGSAIGIAVDHTRKLGVRRFAENP